MSSEEKAQYSGTVPDVIKSTDERLEYYIFHVLIKQSQAASFEQFLHSDEHPITLNRNILYVP